MRAAMGESSPLWRGFKKQNGLQKSQKTVQKEILSNNLTGSICLK